MNAAKILEQAISEKKTVTFEYDGHKRIVEPHHYGRLGNSQQLHGYQTGGTSSSGNIPEWRNFKLEKMERLAKNDEVFTAEKSYNASNSKYSEIEKQIK